MASKFRGQRFHVNLNSDDDEDDGDVGDESVQSSRWPGAAPQVLDPDFVRDVTERSADVDAKPPSPPKFKSTETGFPAHKKRLKSSAFKKQRKGHASNGAEASRSTPAKPSPSPRITLAYGNLDHEDAQDIKQNRPTEEQERDRIDKENNQRLAQMSSEEIEQEKQELMAGLTPSLIERFLQKATLDDGSTEISSEQQGDPDPEKTTVLSKPSKKVTFDEDTSSQTSQPNIPFDPDLPPSEPPPDLFPASSKPPPSKAPSIHFPQPPEAPIPLDPLDPNFLSSLHSKYFATLPADPSKLAWMAPIPTEDSPADKESPYNPLHKSLPASSLRFDFRGRLIPPRLARQISSTKGLHNHGMAPEAAGYTVPELAHLSRSAYPAQRALAYQTLGRIFYRLGRGDFGQEGVHGDEEELYRGLWRCMEEGRVLDTLVAEAGMEEGVGHRTCRILAMEAVWLWRKGGGKKLGAK
ncbi:MAG: hypothetical protein MMC33_006938 [Icmadophila ericetorum]|nr:hypothetical protein [Icmadophila ericetorum]